MNLYLLRRKTDLRSYDVANGFVVRAETPSKARRAILDSEFEIGDEGPEVWTDTRRSSCKKIGVAPDNAPRGIVLRDFRNG